jgi:hypothetical protein
MSKCVAQVFDIDTGEVIDESKIYSYQTLDNRQKQLKYLKSKRECEEQSQQINEKFKEYGSFVWNVYNISQQNFVNLKASNITRLMFLSTYLNYNGYLMFNQHTVMNKKNMNQLLGLSEREFQYFFKDITKNNILKVKDDRLYINQDIFGKGNLSKSKITKFIQQDKFITRLYIDGVRKLYITSTPHSHKTLSYIFRILPYVNRQYNIVCFNPLEENLDNIQCMSLGEFCNSINYNSHNIRQLQKNLFEPTFNIHGKITNAICCVSKGLNNSDCRIFINPRVYYAGDQWKRVEVLGGF